jgi:Protein of unknown function (DUF692)
VTVHVPPEILGNLDSFQKVQASVFGRFGCPACNSGIQIDWRADRGVRRHTRSRSQACRTRSSAVRLSAYVAAIAEQADCGILLDLHNIWTNQRNGRQPVTDYIAQLPLDRVWEVHLAGGFETGGFYLDAHVGAIDPELRSPPSHGAGPDSGLLPARHSI